MKVGGGYSLTSRGKSPAPALNDNPEFYFPFKCQITGQTALHAACAAGSVGCVREILEAGADYDAVDSENNHSAHK